MSTKHEASSTGWPAGRSAARYGDAERVHRGSPLIVYEFEQVDKLLLVQTLHYGFGGPAVILAALAGSSAVAAWGSGGSSGGWALLSAVIAVGAGRESNRYKPGCDPRSEEHLSLPLPVGAGLSAEIRYHFVRVGTGARVAQAPKF